MFFFDENDDQIMFTNESQYPKVVEKGGMRCSLH
jgi:hypothetical protein